MAHPIQRFSKSRSVVYGEWLSQHPFHRVPQIVLLYRPKVNNVAGDAQADGHFQRIVRLGQQRLQPRVESQRLAGAGLLDHPVRIAALDLLAHEAMHPVADFRRRARQVNLLEQIEHAVEYRLLLRFAGLGQPRRRQRLTQETGVTIQVGLHDYIWAATCS